MQKRIIVVLLLLSTFLVLALIQALNTPVSGAATKPCSTLHTCLKNHSYPSYCTGSTGDTQNGYNIVPCGNGGVTPTASTVQNTPVASASPTSTSQGSKNSQNPVSDTNNGIPDDI